MIPTQEVPLPNMPAVPTLWAVHVEGPDDVLAAPDRESADKQAAGINDWYEGVTRRDDFDPATFPRVHAEVIEWPYDPASHAEALAEQAEEAAA